MKIEMSQMDVEALKDDIHNCLNILYCIRDVALTNPYRGISILSSGGINHLRSMENIVKRIEQNTQTR